MKQKRFGAYNNYKQLKTNHIMKNSNNPIVQDVIERFNTVYKLNKIFVTGNSAQKGIIISGDAGTGKSHYVQKAFVDSNVTDKVDYNKSKSFSAAALYVKLYLNRNEGDVVVFDDCNLAGMSGNDFKTLVDLFKGATEMTKGERMLGWERATTNPLMKDNNVPHEFNFQGSIVWITNYSFEQLAKKFGPHWEAIQSRFINVPIRLNDQEKLMYTLFLVEEIGMLSGDICQTKEGGYSDTIVTATTKYIRDNYKFMNNVTARVAAKIADTMENFPEDWKLIIENQTMSSNV
tara:strand:+ start:229 stop:1098 length:870 start_codon:yes stop_codon:yes gene_type:complete